MSSRLSISGAGRRQFLREGLRIAALGALAAICAKLAARKTVQLPGQVCIRDGICRGCPAFEACGLPQALSARDVLSHASSRLP
jgi:hypothetical protein